MRLLLMLVMVQVLHLLALVAGSHAVEALGWDAWSALRWWGIGGLVFWVGLLWVLARADSRSDVADGEQLTDYIERRLGVKASITRRRPSSE